jgi:pSer/pThr/pTyr-binding forkhead associated (FHA) protein
MYEMTICNAEGQALRKFDLSRAVNTGKRVLIGRADDCDVRIKSTAVSRHHCEIEAIDADEWIIRDLGSTLGVLVDGQKVKEAEIEAGMEVSIGPAVLRFESLTNKIAADLAREIGEEE